VGFRGQIGRNQCCIYGIARFFAPPGPDRSIRRAALDTAAPWRVSRRNKPLWPGYSKPGDCSGSDEKKKNKTKKKKKKKRKKSVARRLIPRNKGDSAKLHFERRFANTAPLEVANPVAQFRKGAANQRDPPEPPFGISPKIAGSIYAAWRRVGPHSNQKDGPFGPLDCAGSQNKQIDQCRNTSGGGRTHAKAVRG